jgi:two-component system, OmpR family, response regulator
MSCTEDFEASSELADNLVKVFIAEDEKDAARSLADLLEAHGGIQVIGTASSEQSAVEWIVNHGAEADLLITDLLLMPGGSGFGVISHARNTGAFRKIVVLSSFVTPAVAQRCRKLGADAVFNKTEDLSELLRFVADLRSST